MSKKSILIVARTFYPENSPRSFRTTELAKEFARQGHQVDVLLPENLKKNIEKSFNHNLNIKFKYYGPLKWKTLTPSSISWIGDWKRKLGRLLFLFFEYPNIEVYFKLKEKLKAQSGYDLMISIAVPHENHWAIAKVRTLKKPIAKTWVADCGDPFMGNVLESIAPPFYFNKFENNFLKKADYISVPTATSSEAYNKKYAHKFRVIPQGFNFEEIKISKENISNEIPTFAYAGGVSATGVRCLHGVINVLKQIQTPFIFKIYSGNGKAVLSDLIKGYEDKIVLHEPIPRGTLLFKLSEMDFLINLDNGTQLNTPSKLIDYALTNKPILNINPLKPNLKDIKMFLERDYSNQFEVKNLESYNIKNVSKQFLKLTIE